MKFTLFGVALATVLLSGAAAAETLTFDFSAPTGDLGTSHTYFAGGQFITLTGYSADFTPIHLFGKDAGGDEEGVGLASDPSGKHEIFGKNLIQIDVSELHDPSHFQFAMNSTTQGEKWSVFGSDFINGPETPLVIDGHDGALHNLAGGFPFYSFFYTGGPAGTGPGGCGRGCEANVLLREFKADVVPIPEPSTWAMLIAGFGLLAGLRAYKRIPILRQS
jgi:hypothetical protein